MFLTLQNVKIIFLTVKYNYCILRHIQYQYLLKNTTRYGSSDEKKNHPKRRLHHLSRKI